MDYFQNCVLLLPPQYQSSSRIHPFGHSALPNHLGSFYDGSRLSTFPSAACSGVKTTNNCPGFNQGCYLTYFGFLMYPLHCNLCMILVFSAISTYYIESSCIDIGNLTTLMYHCNMSKNLADCLPLILSDLFINRFNGSSLRGMT